MDTHFDTNISTLSCVKGALRVLFSRDNGARLQAVKVGKHLKKLNKTGSNDKKVR